MEVGGCHIGTVGRFETDASQIQLPLKLILLGRRVQTVCTEML